MTDYRMRIAQEGMAYVDLAQLKREGDVIYASERFAFGLYDWRGIFGTFEQTVSAPHVWIPKPVELVAAAAALAIVKNPIVTRRFWMGWSK